MSRRDRGGDPSCRARAVQGDAGHAAPGGPATHPAGGEDRAELPLRQRASRAPPADPLPSGATGRYVAAVLWLSRPPYLRWLGAAAILGLALWIELRPRAEVDHPYARFDLAAGSVVDEEAVEMACRACGVFPPVELGGLALVDIPAGEPLSPALIATDLVEPPEGLVGARGAAPCWRAPRWLGPTGVAAESRRSRPASGGRRRGHGGVPADPLNPGEPTGLVAIPPSSRTRSGGGGRRPCRGARRWWIHAVRQATSDSVSRGVHASTHFATTHRGRHRGRSGKTPRPSSHPAALRRCRGRAGGSGGFQMGPGHGRPTEPEPPPPVATATTTAAMGPGLAGRVPGLRSDLVAVVNNSSVLELLRWPWDRGLTTRRYGFIQGVFAIDASGSGMLVVTNDGKLRASNSGCFPYLGPGCDQCRMARSSRRRHCLDGAGRRPDRGLGKRPNTASCPDRGERPASGVGRLGFHPR